MPKKYNYYPMQFIGEEVSKQGIIEFMKRIISGWNRDSEYFYVGFNPNDRFYYIDEDGDFVSVDKIEEEIVANPEFINSLKEKYPEIFK